MPGDFSDHQPGTKDGQTPPTATNPAPSAQLKAPFAPPCKSRYCAARPEPALLKSEFRQKARLPWVFVRPHIDHALLD